MILLGADPELVVVDPGGHPVPAHTWYPHKRAKVVTGCGSYYRDGFMVELNPCPNTCRALFAYGVRSLFQAASSQLPAGYRLVSTPTVTIDPTTLDDAPSDVSRFGCESAHNAYTGLDEVPRISADHRRRYAGGHLHLGVPRSAQDFGWMHDPEMRRLYIRMVDRRVGVPLAYITATPAQFDRRRYYGRAGEMRYQEYNSRYHGVEWRVPGADIWNNNALVSFALGVMRHIAYHFREHAGMWDPASEAAVARAINTGRGLAALLPDQWRDTNGVTWYTKSLLTRLARARAFAEFGLPYEIYDMHLGWYEWCDMFAPEVVGEDED